MADPTLKDELCRAINNRLVVEFRYDNRDRVANPHGLFKSDGNYVLASWQTGGSSRSGSLPQWRNFEVTNVRNLIVTDTTFDGPQDDFDAKHFGEIICALK